MYKIIDAITGKKKSGSSGREEIKSLIPEVTTGTEKRSLTKLDMAVGKEIVEGRIVKNPLWRGINDDGFLSQDYDFDEFNRAENVDSYIATTFRLTVEQCMKQGFSFTGEAPELVSGVERRLNQIAEASGSSIYELVEDMITGLTKFNNCFIIFTRKKPKRLSSKFQPFKLHGKKVDPIVGMHYVEPQHMYPRKRNGIVVEWKYRNESTNAVEQTFQAQDVFHARWNKKSDEEFGTPWILPALDDVRMLRRLQEFVQMLISKHLFPIYQYKVGTEKHPAMEFEGGSSEVRKVQGEVQDLPTQGCVFTGHRHEITAIESTGALDIKDYVQYFDQLALSSCGLSGVDVGRGETSNKATAGVMNEARTIRCTRVQKVLTEQLNRKIVNDLLLSMGLDIFDPANNVEMKFAQVDVEEKRAHEKHCLEMFNGGAITHPELRQQCGNKAFSSTDEWEQIQQNTVGRISAQFGQDASINQTKEQNKLKQATTPANQTNKSGKTKPKISKNS